MVFYFDIILFFVLLILIFFLSKYAINEIYYLLRLVLKNEEIIFSIMSIIFLPGTIIHELSHYLVATILFLNIKEVTIFPKFEKNQIKLGGVTYVKKDFIRGLLVGIAPFFVALFIFWLIASFKIFPQTNLGLNVLLIYLIYVISSTMFSSRQDLVDLVFIIPLIIIIMAIIYIFNIRIEVILKNKFIWENLSAFAKIVNFYLFLSLAINFSLLLIAKSLKLIIKR